MFYRCLKRTQPVQMLLSLCENGAEIDDLISWDVVVSQMMGLKDGGLLTKF